MTSTAVAWSAVGLTVTGIVLVIVLVARRAVFAREDAQRRRAEDRLRPVALALAAGDEVPNMELDAADAEIVASILARYARQLTGSARANVAGYFERRGFVTREIARVGSGPAWRRAHAAFALGDMASESAAATLLEALVDDDRAVRAAAARSLGRLGAVEAVEPLVEALVDKRVPRAVAGQALIAIGSASVPRLRALLQHPNAEMRAVVVELIGLVGDASDAAAVTNCLHDTSAEVRAKATRALGRLGAAEAAADLRAALEDRIPYVRATAAIALGMIGDREAAPALLAQARDDEFDPAQAAARALAAIDPQRLWDAARRLGQGPHIAEAADVSAVRKLPAPL